MNGFTFGLSVGAVGLLVVFAGLTILILCLKVMEFLFKERKKTLPAAIAEVPTPALPAEPVHEEGIPSEVIAAITAAISTVWQADTGFVVRRVRRIHNAPAWNRAGRDDQIYSRL